MEYIAIQNPHYSYSVWANDMAELATGDSYNTLDCKKLMCWGIVCITTSYSGCGYIEIIKIYSLHI